MMIGRRWLVAGVLAAMGAGAPTGSGWAQGPQHTPGGPTGGSRPQVQIQMSSGTQEKLEIARNVERQRKLVEDTNKLLELATQLKVDVDKTDKNMLSLDVVKRAEQIEKLARAVKERMKG